EPDRTQRQPRSSGCRARDARSSACPSPNRQRDQSERHEADALRRNDAAGALAHEDTHRRTGAGVLARRTRPALTIGATTLGGVLVAVVDHAHEAVGAVLAPRARIALLRTR